MQKLTRTENIIGLTTPNSHLRIRNFPCILRTRDNYPICGYFSSLRRIENGASMSILGQAPATASGRIFSAAQLQNRFEAPSGDRVVMIRVFFEDLQGQRPGFFAFKKGAVNRF